MENRKTVTLIVPSDIVARGLESILSEHGEFQVQENLVDCSRASEARLRNLAPDIIIIDPSVFDFQGRKEGRLAIAELCDASVIALEGPAVTEDVLKQYDGAISLYDDSVGILKKIHSADDSRQPDVASDGDELSAREKEILVCVAHARGGKVSEVVRFILNEGWSKAGQIITLGNFGSSAYNSREVGEAFRLLEKAMLLELVYPTTSVDVPAIGETRRQPKLVWLDTGLVNYAAQVQAEVLRSRDIMDAWRGMIAEQVVGQELLTQNDKVSQKRNFWSRGKGESSAEVDFIWVCNSKIYPIEVKAGHNAHLRSLHSFMERSSNDVAVRVWSQPYSEDEVVTASGKAFKLINLPFYMVGGLESLVVGK